jgi:diacylglycerol O-acyltransferase
VRPLDGPDLFHLAQERAGRSAHTLKCAVLDRVVPCAEIDRWALAALTHVEPLRMRLAGLPLTRPVWVDGGPSELDYHLRHREVPAPGREEELTAVLSELCSGRLDRARPLWRLWHLTGLESGRDALVFQLHHAVADGAASVALWEAIADGAGPTSGPMDPPSHGLAAGTVARGASELARLPSQVRRFLAYVQRSKAIEHSEEPAVTKAFVAPPTTFNRDPEERRRCSFVTLSLPRLQAVGRACGASLNEVFLTIGAGAVRRHLDGLHEPPVAALTATVPAALPERTQPWGNSVTTLYTSLHSDVADPRRRLEAVQASLGATRRATDHDPRLLPDWQRYPRLNGGLIRLMELAERRGGRPAYNLIVSSVRGPTPFSLAGSAVTELRSIGPLSGRLGLNITGWSYGDAFTVGIHTFASAGDHLDRLGHHLDEELTELERTTSAVMSPA